MKKKIHQPFMNFADFALFSLVIAVLAVIVVVGFLKEARQAHYVYPDNQVINLTN